MKITKMSSKGQVIIPKALREMHHWEEGQELIAIDMGDGILLKPKKPFAETTLDQVAGCLKYQGTPKSLEDMEDAIRQGLEELVNGNN
ncbi:MAG: AbrB/MazE/SpoVT family DNA-binding domain-containing protein [Pleurocapsa sp. SU_5_0]|nr:AbrB/MazE/SpoVT family DNA-binding domain-containing protein [Pleurocapsa sp. SU_5_0]NJO97200.1 AbrB/MazE/SpoVT family DNA-binding domain-containing protein [Pleurocapsa sp. CRU_1_2]NJR46194.1 AbrB/MazE/SpoVT family DNA-binding domain-containing protein [Hyellaceae cyanobacterium CSU_1_1]